MKENEGEKSSIDPSTAPIDLAVAMESARELSPEMLSRSAEILNESLIEAQREEAMGVLLEEFNRRINEDYRRRLSEKEQGGGSPADA